MNVTTQANDGGHLTNCYVAPRDYSSDPLFVAGDGVVRAYLDKYAVIPLEVFEAMGGTEHPAFAEFLDRKRQEFRSWNPQ